jgi:hypothetical protein
VRIAPRSPRSAVSARYSVANLACLQPGDQASPVDDLLARLTAVGKSGTISKTSMLLAGFSCRKQ